MESVKIRNKDMYWDIAADIHFPPDFDKKRKYPAIISAHPIGSCKEQTSGNVYGTALAKEGFVVIAFSTPASKGPAAANPASSKIRRCALRTSAMSPTTWSRCPT